MYERKERYRSSHMPINIIIPLMNIIRLGDINMID